MRGGTLRQWFCSIMAEQSMTAKHGHHRVATQPLEKKQPALVTSVAPLAIGGNPAD